jgi:ribosomal protein L11 methyltransferase
MFQVCVNHTRDTVELISDEISQIDPSPVLAVTTFEVSRYEWRLEALCETEEDADGLAGFIADYHASLSPVVIPLEQRDWVAVSLEGLPPVVAGPFVITGGHGLMKARTGKREIVIEAGEAFGTGHHGTTIGCLEALAATAATRSLGRVLDVGTGSGVLAIAAAQLGACRVVATEIDARAVDVARQNAAANRARQIHCLEANGLASTKVRALGPYDTIVANILARPLIRLAPSMVAALNPGGRIILSGLLTFQEPLVCAAYTGRGMILSARARIDGWATLVFDKLETEED